MCLLKPKKHMITYPILSRRTGSINGFNTYGHPIPSDIKINIKATFGRYELILANTLTGKSWSYNSNRTLDIVVVPIEKRFRRPSYGRAPEKPVTKYVYLDCETVFDHIIHVDHLSYAFIGVNKTSLVTTAYIDSQKRSVMVDQEDHDVLFHMDL